MRKVEISPYELSPSRRGALLRFEFEEGYGYADCHPWPELGDAPLEEQLSSLGRGLWTPLLRRSVEFARRDARARAEGVSLLAGLKIPRSHFLVVTTGDFSEQGVQAAQEQGFERFKLKVGREPAAEIARIRAVLPALGPETKLRLDFNSLLNQDALFSFLDALGPALAKVEFLEDPLPWNEMAWAELRRRFGVGLALDREWAPGRETAADRVVVKPAVQETPQGDLPLVFTSYLDHPLGQVCAAYEAGRALKAGRKVEICGLNSHRVYAENSFSRLLDTAGPEFCAPEGTGFGFDDLLAELSWRPIP